MLPPAGMIWEEGCHSTLSELVMTAQGRWWTVSCRAVSGAEGDSFPAIAGVSLRKMKKAARARDKRVAVAMRLVAKGRMVFFPEGGWGRLVVWSPSVVSAMS